MKRLRFLAIISVLLFGVLGGFVVPEKTFAVVDKSEVTAAMKAVDAQILSIKGRADLGLERPLQLKYVNQLHTFEDRLVNNAEASETTKSVIYSILLTFEDYLIKESNSSFLTDGAKLTISADRDLIAGLIKKAETDLAVERGTMTREDADKLVTSTTATGIANAAPKVAKIEADNQKKPNACNIWEGGGFSLGDCLDSMLAWIITHTFLQIVGYLLWLTANLMNFSIKMGILEFAKWAPDTLYPIWIVVRQIISLIIVFAGLYLGFMYIIDRGKEFERYIPWVVMFALFVNFSYPFVRTIVDVSNIVSLNIYTSTVGKEVLTQGSSGNNSAGAIIRNKLGLIGLIDYATGDEKMDKDAFLNKINSTPVALLAVIFIGYAAYIFFMVTALIVMRTVALIFLIVASPILLVDSVIPALGDKAKEMRKLFFEQLVVGPIFMIMLALTLKFLDVFKTGSNSAMGATGAISGTGGGDSAVVMFFNLLIMLVMLHIMLKVTKSAAGSLGEMATGAIGKVGGFGLGVASGGAGFLARQSIGMGAAKLRDSSWVKNNQDGIMGRGVHRMSNSVASSTFDLRNSKVVAGQANKLGVGMGMGSKMGYSQTVEARQKAAVDGYDTDIYYKEDVLGKDKDGKTVVLHKQGEVDENAKRAQERYYEKAGGRSIFMTKEQKLKTQELLKAKSRENLSKEQAEIEKLASENTKQYESMKEGKVLADGTVLTREKAKIERERIAKELTDELAELKKRDPYSANKETRALDTAVQKIKEQERGALEAEIVERQNFVKQAKAAFKEYKSIQSEAEKEKFFGKQSKEIEEAVKKLERGESLDEPTTTPKTPADSYREASSINTEHVDIDLTPTQTEEIASRREEKLKTATAQAQNEMAVNAPKRSDGETGGAQAMAPTEPKNPPTGTAVNAHPLDDANMF